jgi:hypothetical protein
MKKMTMKYAVVFTVTAFLICLASAAQADTAVTLGGAHIGAVDKPSEIPSKNLEKHLNTWYNKVSKYQVLG